MPERERRKVLLIGWDGADWEHIHPLLDEGLLPNLELLLERGVMGNLATLQPVLSPMLWNSIATGKLADKHGVHGFMEPDPDSGGARPFSSLSRKCKAIWNILNQEGYRSNVVGWWASHPAEPINGAIVTNMFNQVQREPLRVPPGTIHPAEREEELGDLRVEPGELTSEDILPFIPKAAEIDQDKDPRLRAFVKVLSDCASTQAVVTQMMEDGEWDFTAVYFDTIDHFCHGFAEFHPPRQEHIPEESFEIYKDVLRTAYRFHDIMLARQLELAGPDALVLLCSDHGFHSRHLRPRVTPREPAGPAVWHRDMGIFVLSGPGIRKDERIYGANIIDVTPTLLAAMGLPVGDDMDGRVLIDVFEKTPQVRTVPSWEDVPGEDGRHPPGTRIDPDWSERLTKQFVALGYVEDHSGDRDKAAESAQTESDYNLARVYFSSRRYEEAIPLFEKLMAAFPWEDRFIQHLTVALMRSGYSQQCLDLIAASYPGAWTPPNLMMTRVFAILGVEGREAAIEAFHAIPEQALSHPRMRRQVGTILSNLGRLEEAAEQLEQAIADDADDYAAMGELAKVLLKQRRWEESADRAMDSVARLHQQPKVHYTLGQALLRLGYLEQAAHAFEVALAMRPGMYGAHRRLSVLYAKQLNNPDGAARHHVAARKLLEKQRARRTSRQPERARKKWTIPDLPPPEERLAQLKKERMSPEERELLKGTSGKTFTIVSGLPRSGTSLMMQMLDAAGMSPQTDGIRKADEDNPRGYWEWESLKQTADLKQLFDETEGLEQRAIKVVSALVPTLPIEHSYRIIFMLRPLEEVARSQARMIERLGTEGAGRDEAMLIEELKEHRERVMVHLQRQKNVKVLPVRFPVLVANPEAVCGLVAEFLGESLARPEALGSVIDPALYRQRSESGSTDLEGEQG
ncbi:MAG: alkaline phosphatase family protein [Roseibacillus sp.]|jgi:predicted AlkP superfamily phosphohydrolase/phosphomutase/tetratricopeptide (TPR) repeat protein